MHCIIALAVHSVELNWFSAPQTGESPLQLTDAIVTVPGAGMADALPKIDTRTKAMFGTRCCTGNRTVVDVGARRCRVSITVCEVSGIYSLNHEAPQKFYGMV